MNHKQHLSKFCKPKKTIKNTQTFSFSEETSSDDWEKLSSGEKSPRKQSKDEVRVKFFLVFRGR